MGDDRGAAWGSNKRAPKEDPPDTAQAPATKTRSGYLYLATRIAVSEDLPEYILVLQVPGNVE